MAPEKKNKKKEIVMPYGSRRKFIVQRHSFKYN